MAFYKTLDELTKRTVDQMNSLRRLADNLRKMKAMRRDLKNAGLKTDSNRTTAQIIATLETWLAANDGIRDDVVVQLGDTKLTLERYAREIHPYDDALFHHWSIDVDNGASGATLTAKDVDNSTATAGLDDAFAVNDFVDIVTTEDIDSDALQKSVSAVSTSAITVVGTIGGSDNTDDRLATVILRQR